MIEPNTLECGNSLELVQEIPENSVDMLVTDPPYNISTDFSFERSDDGKYAGSNVSHDFGDWDQGDITVENWLPLFEPCLKPNAVVFVMYDYFQLTDVVDTMRKLGWEPRQPIIWHKQNPIPQGYAVKWQDAAEMGVIATVNEGQGHHYQEDEGQRHNIIKTSLCQGEERYEHPTQKPEGLFEPIVRWWSEDGDVILDPFMGTGTVPAVARKKGRRYIGIEEDEQYVAMAQHRMGEDVDYNDPELVYDANSALEW